MRGDRAGVGREQKGRAHTRRRAGPIMLGMGLVWRSGPCLSPAQGQDKGQKNDLFQPSGNVQGREEVRTRRRKQRAKDNSELPSN